VSELPVSVRLSLWASAACAGLIPLTQVVARAMPDLDVVSGNIERLSTWAELGERVVLVALPHPGHLGLLPRGAEVTSAATEAGECVYVPALGDVLVPSLSELGPPDGAADDRVSAVRWAAYSGEPVPVHAVEALDIREVERRLREVITEASERLETMDARPWASLGLRDLFDSQLDDARWGLPPGLPPRVHRLIAGAATLGTAADLGLSRLNQAHALTITVARDELLTRLRREADLALAEATCVGALHLAGWRGPDSL